MKISVVTTSFNREHTIGRALRSVMSQTYADVEHIVVDGASKDGTLAAIKACGSTRIAKMISEPDHGCYEALNKGLRMATGEIIGWLHSDDEYFDTGVLSRVAEVFDRTGCDLVYGDGVFVSAQNPSWMIRDWRSGKFSDQKMRFGWLPLHTTVFVRRSIIERFGGYREYYRVSSDSEWLLRVMYKTGIHIEYLPSHVVRMDYGGLSTTGNLTVLRWREDLGVYANHGISPRLALICKILRKVPQFLAAPFLSKR